MAAFLLELSVEKTQAKQALGNILSTPPPGRYPHDPKPLLPDTAVPPREGEFSSITEAALWQCFHIKREFRENAGAFLRGATRSRPKVQSWGKRPRGRFWGLGDAGEGWLREVSSYCQWVLSGPPGILGQ